MASDLPNWVDFGNLAAQKELVRLAGWGLIISVTSAVISLIALFGIWCSIRSAAKTYASDISVSLSFLLIDGENFRPRYGQAITPLRCIIHNSGRGTAVITRISRCWAAQSSGSDFSHTNINLELGAKDTFLRIGPQGSTLPIYSLSQDEPNRDVKYEEGIWLYFFGYFDYEIDNKERYRSKFFYVFRPDIPEIGLHAAFMDRPGEYWKVERLMTG